MNQIRRIVAIPIKGALRQLAPRFTEEWLARRENRHAQNFFRELGVPALVDRYVDRFGSEVQSGPFTGLALEGVSAGSALLPKLIGSYEQELHPAIERLLSEKFEAVLDVGAAEGYYAVGFAKFGKSECPVYAFDINPDARDLCTSLARLNRVDSCVEVLGRCTPELLAELVSDRRGLVFSDCEGYERHLFTEFTLPALAQCDLVIELHEERSKGVSDFLSSLISSTHTVELIPMLKRDPSEWETVSIFNDEDALTALSEFRSYHQEWLIATPRSRQISAISD